MKVGETMADKWEWQEQLAKAHLIQEDAGALVGLSKSQTSHLVKKMIQGKGLTATETDKRRWDKLIETLKNRQVVGGVQ